MSSTAFFIGDHAALDFLNTTVAPRSDVIEFIPDGVAYLSWLVDAGLLGSEEKLALALCHKKAALDRVAHEARILREWFRLLIPEITGAKSLSEASQTLLRAKATLTLNVVLSLDNTHRALEADGKRLVLREVREYTNANQLLVPVAEAIAKLLTTEEQSLIKRCANSNCTMWFLDCTKAHRRLFCSAAVCGNRAKVAAFRERQRHAK